MDGKLQVTKDWFISVFQLMIALDEEQLTPNQRRIYAEVYSGMDAKIKAMCARSEYTKRLLEQKEKGV
jgi:competence protein ComGF